MQVDLQHKLMSSNKSVTNQPLLFFLLQKFKSLLISELSKVFPEEMSKYKAIHGEDAPS